MFIEVIQMIIPEKVDVEVNDALIIVKGPNGAVQRKVNKLISFSKKDKELNIDGKNRALVGTWEAHIKNMFIGVTNGFTINLKTIHAHFPMSIKVNGDVITIENFLGEKKPRKARRMGDTKVDVKGQLVTLSGPDKEDVGNTYGSLRQATKIKEKDGRVFQDGIYKV